MNFRYSFLIKRDGEKEKEIKYSKDNIIFYPEKAGEYEVEIKVKEKVLIKNMMQQKYKL